MQYRIQLLFILLCAITGVTFFYVRSITQTAVKSNVQTVSVVASFYPLAAFASEIGKDVVQVINLTPAGVEPHEFEPTAQELTHVYASALFIYNGTEFQPWVDRVLPDLAKQGVTTVDTTIGIERVKDMEGTRYDPHVWLDPVLAQKQVQHIAEAFSLRFPNKAQLFKDRALVIQERLHALDTAISNGLSQCRLHTVITSHNAFTYFAKRYHLTIIPISGVSPEEEPTAKALATIIEAAKENHVQTIFFETLVSPKLAESIAKEIGGKTAVFNPIEGISDAEIIAGQTYETIMRENLNQLRLALACI